MGRKILFLYNLQDPENPVELVFQASYGGIVAYEWYGDGYILIGFNAGFIVSISTNKREMGQELFRAKNHHVRLTSLTISNVLGKMATCGDNTVKIHDLNVLANVTSVITLSDEAGVDRVGWSEDGGLMLTATNTGSAIIYVSKLARLFAVHSNVIAILTSLTQLTLFLIKGKSMSAVNVRTEVEPTIVALGPYHLIVAMNNRSWIYDLTGDSSVSSGLQALGVNPVLIGDREYVSNVKSICLNAEYTAALSMGKIHLHLTEGVNGPSSARERDDKEMKVFPSQGEQMFITCHALTTDFLVYASDMGDVQVFGLEDWKKLTECRHVSAIRALFPDSTATRVIIIDDKNEGYLYSPVNSSILALPNFPSSAVGVLWDQWQTTRHVFYAFNTQTIVTYVYIRDSLDGTTVSFVGETKLPLDQIPLLVQGGVVTLETPGGKLANLTLSTHNMPSSLMTTQPDNLKESLQKNLALCRYSDAWNICLILNDREEWTKLGNSALYNLDLETGLRTYRHIGDVGMVNSLEGLLQIENKKLLAGHIAELLGDFNKAEALYLESSEPINALTMRQHLLQWDQALQLARNLAPHQVPYTSLEYAHQLELTGLYSEALVHYERALVDRIDTSPAIEEHNDKCRSGIARTSLRVGDYRRGLAIANDPTSSKALKNQCAEILESVKKLNDAAFLYEKAESYNSAAAAYIGMKNWKKVGELLPKVTQPKIYQQYAKAKESDGDYQTAVNSYSSAGDVENVVRLLIDKLNQPQRAVAVVQESRNIEAAKMVAKFFEKVGEHSSALKFLVMSRCENEALRLCKEHGLIELYANLITEEMGGSEDGERQLASLAVHFEQHGNLLLAAKCYYHAAQFNKALRNLVNLARGNPQDNEAISLAIEVVGAANDDSLANVLIELLLGELDGEPRDPKYVFKLYKARKQYKEAAKTAIIIASEELVNGNYSNGHAILLGMCMDLNDVGLPIAGELMSLLGLLHSYRLVRLHVRRNDHYKAARMLLRVADNISKFPAHVVPILTSTVIECHKADLKASAFHYAAMLMRPEYKSKVDPKYVKKLEGVVRRPPRGADNKLAVDRAEATSPCPCCDYDLRESQLVCIQCSNTIPFCIATGRHIVRDDFTVCPNCQFPAIRSELIK
ncbi:hypothetical protein AAG570_005427 [Ranatra chinensis]|uniref:WD repeat-containing protein 19 n=1 Tax=Ranatra chinensis TaxID=642074 RepID=A0ABD0XYF1_9HEMI